MLLVQYGVFCTFFILNIIENSHGIQHTMLQNPKNPRSPISANKLNSNFLKMTRANVFQTSCTHMIWSKLLIPMFLQKFVLQIFPNKHRFLTYYFSVFSEGLTCGKSTAQVLTDLFEERIFSIIIGTLRLCEYFQLHLFLIEVMCTKCF